MPSSMRSPILALRHIEMPATPERAWRDPGGTRQRGRPVDTKLEHRSQQGADASCGRWRCPRRRTRPDPAQPLPREQRGRSSAPPRSQSDKADAEKRESAGFGDCDCGCKSATDALVERYGPYLPIAVNLHVHKAKSAQDGSGDCCSKAGRGWKPPQIKQRKYRAAGIQRSAKICDEAIRGSKRR
jgi:hypothetical protein